MMKTEEVVVEVAPQQKRVSVVYVVKQDIIVKTVQR
jgi:hypothetical protein